MNRTERLGEPQKIVLERALESGGPDARFLSAHGWLIGRGEWIGGNVGMQHVVEVYLTTTGDFIVTYAQSIQADFDPSDIQNDLDIKAANELREGGGVVDDDGWIIYPGRPDDCKRLPTLGAAEEWVASQWSPPKRAVQDAFEQAHQAMV